MIGTAIKVDLDLLTRLVKRGVSLTWEDKRSVGQRIYIRPDGRLNIKQSSAIPRRQFLHEISVAEISWSNGPTCYASAFADDSTFFTIERAFREALQGRGWKLSATMLVRCRQVDDEEAQ